MLGIASLQNFLGENDATINKIQQLKLQQQQKDSSPTLDDSGLTMEVRKSGIYWFSLLSTRVLLQTTTSESESEEELDETQIKELEKDEPLLQDNPGRFVILPIQYHDIWAFYKKAVGKLSKKF